MNDLSGFPWLTAGGFPTWSIFSGAASVAQAIFPRMFAPDEESAHFQEDLAKEVGLGTDSRCDAVETRHLR
jgi:hypothetical protein